MRLADFPTELDTQIIEHLHDDRQALSSFSRVNKYYRTLCEPILYRDLTFRNLSEAQVKRLLMTLLDMLSLAKHIKTVTFPIEVLAMTETATWLCLGILCVLMLILVVLIISLWFVYPPIILQRKVECLADVIAMVEGSEDLLACIEQYDVQDLKKSTMETRLGWFRNKRTGVTRWGIEVYDADGVEWVEKPEKLVARELANSVVWSLGTSASTETEDKR
jgi:hypothetical protein